MTDPTLSPLLRINNNVCRLPVPTLKTLSYYKVSSTLWSCNYEVGLKYFRKRSKYVRYVLKDHWPVFAQNICAKVDQLTLPAATEARLRETISHIGYNLLDWLYHIQKYQFFLMSGKGRKEKKDWIRLISCIKHTHWTSYGRIDDENTTRALLQSEDTLTQSEKYEMAMSSCLDDAYDYLPTEIPDTRWELGKGNKDFKVMEHFEFIWHVTYALKHELDSNPQDLFIFAVRRNNFAAAKHYWLQMSKNEQRYFLIHTPLFCINDLNVMVFLLQQMNENQFNAFFTKIKLNNPSHLIHILYRWGSVDWFFAIFNFTVDSFNEIQLYYILSELSDLIAERPGRIKLYSDVFWFVWNKCSLNVKKYVLDQEESEQRIFEYFQIGLD